MAIGKRVVGLGNIRTARTEPGTVVDVEDGPLDHPEDVRHVKVAWDSGDTTWVSADGVTPER